MDNGSKATNKGAITSNIKRAIKLKTSTAKLAQLLQSLLAFCVNLQPMTAHWTMLMLMRAATLVAGLVSSFIACFRPILLVNAP